jgi:hypothetical protein
LKQSAYGWQSPPAPVSRLASALAASRAIQSEIALEEKCRDNTDFRRNQQTSAARPMCREAASARRKQRFSADDPALKSLLFSAYISKSTGAFSPVSGPLPLQV